MNIEEAYHVVTKYVAFLNTSMSHKYLNFSCYKAIYLNTCKNINKKQMVEPL